MSLKQFTSPSGSPIVGTLESITGCAGIIGIDPVTGTPEYDGETKVFWDGQTTVYRDGKMIFLDEDGESWTFDQLTQVIEDGEDDFSWPEDETHTMEDWRHDVSEGNTRLGYAEWVQHQREAKSS